MVLENNSKDSFLTVPMILKYDNKNAFKTQDKKRFILRDYNIRKQATFITYLHFSNT